MNIRKLCSELAKLEKTKSQAKIQAIRSIVGHLSDIFYENHVDFGFSSHPANILYENGVKRMKRRKRKKK